MSVAEHEHTKLPIPNGWFAVAWAHELVAGDVKRVHCFGQELVLFRTRTGKVRLLDGYCSHLGAHLAEGGHVVGEGVQCPFHGWQYCGATGKCTSIPYAERIPAKAKVKPWHVVEINRMIFAWHHSGGEPPSWEIPLMSEFDDPAWTAPRTFELEVPVHMQDMAENNNDPVHFHYVHGMTEIPETETKYDDDGRRMVAVSRGEQVTPFGTFQTELIRDTFGLGLVAVRIEGMGDAGLLMYSSTSPVDHCNTHSRWLFTCTENLVDVAGEHFIRGMQQGVMQDMRIWQNKIHRSEPVLCEGDGFLAEFRRWTKQFY